MADLSTPSQICTPFAIDDTDSSRKYLNRELSWIDFNARVLAAAQDTDLPLLERAKFLAIFSSNLDEFYMVRVAGLKRRNKSGLSVRSADGLTPNQQLELISSRTRYLCELQSDLLMHDILPGLEAEGIKILNWQQLTAQQQQLATKSFHEEIFPVITPLAVDPAHPFPYISGLSLNLAVTIRDPETTAEHFARVKIPNNVPRLIRIVSENRGEHIFIPAEDIIAAHLNVLFNGMEIVEHHIFRVTRNADMMVEEDRDEDLLQALEKELAKRRFGSAVRLEISDDMTDHMLKILIRELDINDDDVVQLPGFLDLTCLWQVYGVEREDLKLPVDVPSTHPGFGERETQRSVFTTLQETDVLVHHPFQSFATSVQRFIEQATADPDVLAIKQTLYRTSGDSPIVNALIDAATAGKQVVALVEIMARFDEKNNIRWARELERAGVHVVYGLLGLKTHCKTCLVVRREGNSIRRYCHIGTGNYNPKTARLYEDVGLFTANEQIGEDLSNLFNSLTGFSRHRDFQNILVAPSGIRSGVVQRIDEEITHHDNGNPSGIRLKANALVDEQIIDALYRASQAGVKVEIVVRGICALRPGVEGLSENITVRSILGNYLEHSRIIHFAGAGAYFIGSADMMHRNLDRRVEVMAQVHSPRLTRRLDAIFDSAMADNTISWRLGSDAVWTKLPSDDTGIDHQQHMMAINRGK